MATARSTPAAGRRRRVHWPQKAMAAEDRNGTVPFRGCARLTERREKRINLRHSIENNRAAREREQKRRRYQNRLSQAALELSFHTPQTAGRWYASWQAQDIYESDLQSLVLTWLKRFVSCRHIDPWEWHDEPLWRVMLDINILAGEMSAFSRMTDRFALPVLLTCRP